MPTTPVQTRFNPRVAIRAIALLLLAVTVLRATPLADNAIVHGTLTAILIVGGSNLVALLVLWLVRRHVRITANPSNDAMGFVYATIGVVYGVLIGFVVVTVWQQFQDAQSLEDAESHTVTDLFRFLPGLPDADQQEARATLVAYLHTTIENEWPTMADGREPDERGRELLDRLWAMYGDARNTPAAQNAFFAQGLQRLDDLGQLRRERLLASRHGLPEILWAALVIGAALTIVFADGFAVESGAVHAWLVSALTTLIALLLLLTIELDRPYSGDVRIEPDRFEFVLEQFAPAGIVPEDS